MEFCPNCGFQKELCICSLVEKKDKEQKAVLRVSLEYRRYSKEMIVIKPIENTPENKLLLQKIKKAFQTGGTLKNRAIEIRHSNMVKVIEFLRKNGYKVQMD